MVEELIVAHRSTHRLREIRGNLIPSKNAFSINSDSQRGICLTEKQYLTRDMEIGY